MRILVAEDEFERAGSRAAVGALISRSREHSNGGRAGAPFVPLRGYVLAKPAS